MNYTKISDKIVNNIKEKILLKNTDGTLGINACGVESSGLDDANYLNETIDCEARKNSVNIDRNLNHLQWLRSSRYWDII